MSDDSRIERRWRKAVIGLKALKTRINILEPEGPADFFRADGRCVCETCGLEYVDHPELDFAATFHVLCNGEIAKL